MPFSLRTRHCDANQPVNPALCDSGSEIPEKNASQLLRTVVESEDGLGVELFQAARWAEQSGYRLQLQENRKGRVCIELVEFI